ncbi:hypothetical protein PENSPDRAFT_691331 [Peniophora sp. CONT]|nr:hypothetical protein PENSPDRAFT_691331 [Peniophora sp. CONT]
MGRPLWVQYLSARHQSPRSLRAGDEVFRTTAPHRTGALVRQLKVPLRSPSSTGNEYSGSALITFGPSIATLMPELSSLHIDGVYLAFMSDIFLNLTELSLGHMKINDSHMVEDTSLGSLLRRTRKLRKLAIHSIWLGNDITTDIPLPESLRYLEYTTPSSLIVFSHFVPFSSVHVKIVQRATPTDSKSPTKMQSSNKIVMSWLGPDSPPTVAHLTVRYNTVAAEACVAYWRDPRDRAANPEPDFQFVRYVDEDFGIGDLLLGPIYDHVTHLSFDVDWDFPLFYNMDDWLHALGPLLKLRSVIITGPCTLAPALPHLARWPQLDSTTLWRPYQLFTEERASMGDVKVLIDWLTTRKSRGLPLQKLTVPAHVGVALDEAAVAAESSGTTDWRTLVSNVHLDYNIWITFSLACERLAAISDVSRNLSVNNTCTARSSAR